MKLSLGRITGGLAALILVAGALLPFNTGCGLAGGCPITDDGEDSCRSGEKECSGATTVRTCVGGEGCDKHWTSTKCASGEVCVVVDSVVGCRPIG